MKNGATWAESQRLLPIAIIIAVVFLSYSILLSNNFGVMDDYDFLLNVYNDNNGTFTLLTGAGRPLNGILLDLGFRLAGSIEGLTVLRLVTLVGISLLGCSIYIFSRAHFIKVAPSLALSCGFVLLPSIQVYAAWAQHFPTPFAGVIGFIGAFILTPPCGLLRRSVPLAVLLSASLLAVAIVIYQPSAMLFCVGILISVISGSGTALAWTARRGACALAVFVLAMGLGFLAFKVGQHFYPTSSIRSGLVGNFRDKILWFISEPLENSLSLYALRPDKFVRHITTAVMIIGIIAFSRRIGLKSVLLILFCSVICIVCSCLPNLATAENWASYRSFVSLSASALIVFVLMANEALGWAGHLAARWSGFRQLKTFLPAIPVTFLVLLIVRTQDNELNSFILPNVTELNNLSSALSEEKQTGGEKISIVVVPSSWSDSAARPLDYDEFGMTGSIGELRARAFVDVVLRSMNLTQKFTIAPPSGPTAVEPSELGRKLVIDFPRLVTSQRFKSDSEVLAKSRLGAVVQ